MQLFHTIDFTCKCKNKLEIDFSDSMLRDQLLVKMFSDDIRTKVLELYKDLSKLTLADLTELIKRYETARRN